MPDPVPPTPPDPNKPKRARGPVNKAHVEAVSKAEKTIAIARGPNYLPTLTAREIDPAFLDALATQCATARATLGGVVDKATDATDATTAETAEQRALVKAIREIQVAAKQKFSDDKPSELKDYYVGANITQSRAQLEQATAAIQKKLATASLPGITPAKLTALAHALKLYQDANSAQAAKQTDAAGGRVTVDDVVDQINKGRRKILFAVEAAWPSDVAANAPIRREFGLPPNRPFVG